MAWVKLDDRFHSHPKVEDAGLAATGLFAMGLSYAACHETDGSLPDSWVRKQGPQRHAQRLVELGLWERIDGGYIIPDFLDFNPSKAEVEARRRVAAERQRRHRSRKGHA